MEDHSTGGQDGTHSGGGFNMPNEEPATPYAIVAEQMVSATTNTEPVNNRAALVSSSYPNLDEEKDSAPTPSWESSSASMPAPPSGTNTMSLSMPTDDRPIPVVKVLSVRGVEYAMMSILLWFGAGSLMFILTSMIQGGSGFDTLAFPLSLLIVCVPGFAFFFLRLKAAELADPSLRLEASKRRYSQITQILAFLTCFFNIVAVTYLLIGMAGGNEVSNIGKTIGAAAVILLIAGGILLYYWKDEHKLVGKR
jgi:hypothetical protein